EAAFQLEDDVVAPCAPGDRVARVVAWEKGVRILPEERLVPLREGRLQPFVDLGAVVVRFETGQLAEGGAHSQLADDIHRRLSVVAGDQPYFEALHVRVRDRPRLQGKRLRQGREL